MFLADDCSVLAIMRKGLTQRGNDVRWGWWEVLGTNEGVSIMVYVR